MCSKKSDKLEFKLIKIEKIPLKKTIWNKGLTAKNHPRILGNKNAYWYGKKLSKEHREKLSKSARTPERIKTAIENLPKNQIGENHPFHGKHHTEETKKKLRLSNLGKKQSRKTIEKRSEKLRGIPRPESVKKKISRKHKGKKLSEVTKRKISEKIKKIYNNDPTYALRTTASLRKRNEYKGSYFGSNEEIHAFKLLHDAGLIDEPKTGLNIQIFVHGILIDFRLKDGSFVEYHPEWLLGVFQPRKEYYEKRRTILNEGGFHDFNLYHFISLDEVEEFITKQPPLIIVETFEELR